MTDMAGTFNREETPAALSLRQVLVVCTANQCRSPMAEGLLKQRLAATDALDRVRVSSAGTWARAGVPATPSAVQVMAERDIDIGAHRSREVSAEILDPSDLILVMTRGHAESLIAEFPGAASRILCFSALVGSAFDIADPVGLPLSEYRATADELARLIDAGWARILGEVPSMSSEVRT
ncbi:MAG TPA: low molecular weight protein arginine phosphatase [Anaerolineae bacterium]|nr:low molecular weight protein arginine phosphatase [Ardenticatenia bacterium]MBK8538475.1 low molecular weight protein arginine phosphatase [Ardenticatenia bacterium]HQZ71718.1 low molecular weight protein arginine phosphatase [Anaerolineae bacterium]HRA21052.1 low molecular weight protein arginine phosphatase [Anaerolineae bacterium]